MPVAPSSAFTQGETMEQLRLKGNACFTDNPAEAAEYYTRAVQLYEQRHGKDAACTLDEFTKSAGNALTCFFKMGETEQCAAMATRVLAFNPILAKANAFYGRCALVDPSLDTVSTGCGSVGAAALVHLCRAIYELPTLEPSTREDVDEALTRLIAERVSATEAFAQSPEPGVRLVRGRHGVGVEAIRTLPPLIEVVSLLTPFSVGAFEDFAGQGCCVECSKPIGSGDAEAGTEEPNEDDGHEEADKANGREQAKNEKKLLRCTTCNMVAYCSPACAEAHREQHEKFECSRMTRLSDMMESIESRRLDVPEQFFELAYHCITTLAGMKAKRQGHENVLKLTSHVDEVIQSLHPVGPLMCDLFKGEEETTTLYIIIGVLRCNALEVTDPSGLGVAQALHVGNTIASFFNHSCMPNCAIDTVRHAIVTTRIIYVGEELSIAYIPQLYWPTRLRRERLSEGYYFVCHCPRCQRCDKDPFELALSMELPAARRGATTHFHPIVQTACATIRSRMVGDVSQEDADKLSKLLSDLSKHLFPFHYLCHEVRNCLSFVHAVLGQTRECLCSCLDELLMWECILPGALPVKQMKIQNALECVQVLDAKMTDCSAALLPHLSRLALMYDAEGPI
ncbi:SET domain/MYND finger containing protein, putative [Leishmania lindenbergi]|uniref:SET domain/MYND finger containing protein n=1 Tax=Leishmania lindenbergi TaxID=651832 RepID=A0AAW3APK0_9TRYP